MGVNDVPPAISPEDQFFVNLATEGRSGNPSPSTATPATPTPGDAAAAPAPAPGAPAPAPAPAAALPPPKPSPGFELVDTPAPAPDPVQRIADAVASRLPAPAPPPAASPAEPDYVLDARALIADPESSAEAVRTAKMVLGQYEREEARHAEYQANEQRRQQAEYDAQLAQEQAAIASERQAIQARYAVTDAELNAIENAWERAAQTNPALLALTFEEAARRAYGDEAWEARRKGFTPAVVPGGQPRPPATGPLNGHLVGDAAGGGAGGPRAPFTPPTDRKPTLDDSKNAALLSLGGR